MLVSIDWIKDFVDIPDMNVKALCDRFTMGCAEVEEVIVLNEEFSKIKIAEVMSFRPHPHADKLHLVTINTGKEKKEIVCGASNLKKNMKTPYAPIGVTLPNGIKIAAKKIRGIQSEGMLCSEKELEISNQDRGIMELPSVAPRGENLENYLNLKKQILLNIDNKSLTHRPDLWGHYGLAREFSVLFDKPLKNPFDQKFFEKIKKQFTQNPSPIIPKVHKSACLAYLGLSIDNISIKNSPSFITSRLNAVGVKSINNIVDISNYVMIELGIPLHIFDRNKIKNKQIDIKRIKKRQSFTTLDNQQRELTEDDTVVMDGDRPLVIGGVMGGLESEISADTKNIFIEVANWRANEIRSTSNRLGLRTEASSRYEKSLDSELLTRTMMRTVELILQCCPNAKIIGKIERDGEELSPKKPLIIPLSPVKINKVLGLERKESQIALIFEKLAFRVDKKNTPWKITVPSFRATKDIECEEDLIEEIGRIIGYDQINPIAPNTLIIPTNLTPTQKLHRKIRTFCQYYSRCFEIMTYPLIGEKLLDNTDWPVRADKLKLKNALSKDSDRMRPSLVPSILQAVAKNNKHSEKFRLFELGRVYNENKPFVKESSHLAIAYYNREKTPFIDLVNAMEQLCTTCRLPAQLKERSSKDQNPLIKDWHGIHPVEFYHLFIMGKIQGTVFSIHPYILKKMKIKGHLSIGLIDLHNLENTLRPDHRKFKQWPSYPGSNFDWTILTDKHISVTEILNCLKKVKMKELSQIKIVKSFPLTSEKNAVTLRARFIDPNKTLDSEFLKNAQDKLIITTQKAGFPLKT